MRRQGALNKNMKLRFSLCLHSRSTTKSSSTTKLIAAGLIDLSAFFDDIANMPPSPPVPLCASPWSKGASAKEPRWGLGEGASVVGHAVIKLPHITHRPSSRQHEEEEQRRQPGEPEPEQPELLGKVSLH